ncbi:MAG: galactose mutarotase, partial [Colwellia sp.]|nr:galactose mutarotase [Colwellia sp.]
MLFRGNCGRVCNRISGGKFQLDDKQYQLPLNDGDNFLHCGYDSFSIRLWKIDKANLTNTSVTLSLVSPD